jgi:hypothetical protein
MAPTMFVTVQPMHAADLRRLTSQFQIMLWLSYSALYFQRDMAGERQASRPLEA